MLRPWAFLFLAVGGVLATASETEVPVTSSTFPYPGAKAASAPAESNIIDSGSEDDLIELKPEEEDEMKVDEEEAEIPEDSTRMLKLLHLRLRRIAKLKEKYIQEQEEARKAQMEKFQAYLQEWERYQPASYLPPPPLPPLDCDCEDDDDDEGMSNELPGFRSISPDDDDDDDEEEDQGVRYGVPIPNAKRYLRPMSTSGNSRHRRSAYEDDDYWYDEGPENYVLQKVNKGYRAKKIYEYRLPYYARPLHFGKIYTGEKFYPSYSKHSYGKRRHGHHNRHHKSHHKSHHKRRHFGYGADFVLPEDYHAFYYKAPSHYGHDRKHIPKGYGKHH